ncbi:MAG: hypothetical protein F4Z16_06655 [Rhodothermaceae bacterium]|nr:hypothetical protein [Rhodothermaceae bacterium]MYD66835.1 hypothetical protein [Rhodothermaceae bacterium]MYI78167.1 hypothetical protein [Gammaproteobacteria bacterium]
MIQTLTLDDVVRGVTQNHLEDDMHIGAIDAELLRRVYKNLDDCQHIQYNVFAADEFGAGVNQIKLRKNATPRELLAEAPDSPPVVILKDDLSPKLMHGDIVMGAHPSSFIALGQVEMNEMARTGYASVRVLTPHAHRIDDSIMVRQHLEKVYKQKKGIDKDSPPMVEMQISDDDPRMLNIPKEQADIQPYFSRDEQWIALYEANDLSIYELVEKSPVDQTAKDAIADLLVKHYYDEWELHGDEVDVLHEAYRDELNETAVEKAELIPGRPGPNASRSVEEDQIVTFKARVADCPKRWWSLPARDAHEDREYYGFPPHPVFSAGVTAMRLLENQGDYFPCHDSLECVNDSDCGDPPIIVEALRADGSLHSQWEFITFEFDRTTLENGQAYPTYYLGEKDPREIDSEEPAKEGAQKESPTGGAPHDYASAQEFLQDHVRDRQPQEQFRGGLER